MSQQIKKAGLKVTGPRMKILEIMERETTDNDVHLSAEDVYKILLKADEEIGLATVYRVLTQFEQAGILKRHNFEGNHSVFEIDSGDHHNHLICVKSGKVVEFYDEVIAQRQREIAEKYGYTLEDHSLILYGVYQGEDAEDED
ncbi:ferric iron uptake transcriptional regulator [Cardiobacteriaceae bacterium TAE3-ERU3]|nr:ferric iron uptake transcriptional regulator [Cardiobacteriaceae bacterium TAE3-ERU3]